MKYRYREPHEMKESDVEGVGLIPNDWRVEKVKYNFDFLRGLPITKANLQDEGIPCLNYGEVHSKYPFEINPTDNKLKKVSESYFESNPNSLLKYGDLVFADTSEDLKGSGNFTFINNSGDIFAGYHTIIMRPNSTNNLKYFAYLFESNDIRKQIQLKVKGVKVYSITQNILKDISILKSNEEDKIANFLDQKTSEFDSVIKKKERLIERLEEVKKSLISEVVTGKKQVTSNKEYVISNKGEKQEVITYKLRTREAHEMKDSGVEWLGLIPKEWDTSKLKYYIKNLESGVSVNSFESESAGTGEIGVLKTSCVSDYTFRPEENKKVIREDLKRVSCPAKENNIIISRMNTPDLVGASGYVKKDFPNLYLPDRLWQTMFHEKNTYNVELMSFILKSRRFKNAITAISTGTSASMKNITKGDFLNLKIPTMPVLEQECILNLIKAKIDQFDELIKSNKRAIIKLKKAKESLISEAVTGKIEIMG